MVCHKVIPSREASFGKIPLAPEVKTRLASLGTERLYTHQCLAIELARLGKNVVVMTPTASGKSLIYNIPVMESMLLEPKSRSLYIFPLKGLAQNQLKVLNELNPEAAAKNAFAIYDGDTPQHKRKKTPRRAALGDTHESGHAALGVLRVSRKMGGIFQVFAIRHNRRSPLLQGCLGLSLRASTSPPQTDSLPLWSESCFHRIERHNREPHGTLRNPDGS